MRAIGGVDCNEEFAQFLIANPSLRERSPIDPDDPAYYYQRFQCTDGGERFYEAIPLTCLQVAISQLGGQFNRILSPSGVSFLESTSIPLPTSSYFEGSPFKQVFCGDGTYYVLIQVGVNFNPDSPTYYLTI